MGRRTPSPASARRSGSSSSSTTGSISCSRRSRARSDCPWAPWPRGSPGRRTSPGRPRGTACRLTTISSASSARLEALAEPDGETTRRARERVVGVVPRHRRRRPHRRPRHDGARGRRWGRREHRLAHRLGRHRRRGARGARLRPRAGLVRAAGASRSPADRPAVAMAASVPFAEDDVVNGLAEPSSLPYSTLLDPAAARHRHRRDVHRGGHAVPGSTLYPSALPLRIGEATPYIENGTQIRPDQPLGQYQLRAAVSGWNVEVNAYWDPAAVGAAPRCGPAPARQAADAPAPTPKRALPTATERAKTAVLARPHVHVHARVSRGGRCVEARVHRGTGRGGAGWQRPAFAAIGTSAGAAASAVENNVAWISAGRPSAEASVASGYMRYTFPFHTWGRSRSTSASAAGRRRGRPSPAGARGLVGDRLRSAARLRDAAAGARPRARDATGRGDAEVLPDIPADDDARKGRRDRGQHAVREAACLRAGARVGSARLFAAKDCVED